MVLAQQFWLRFAALSRSSHLPLYSGRRRCLSSENPASPFLLSSGDSLRGLRADPVCAVGLGQHEAILLGIHAVDVLHLGSVSPPLAPTDSHSVFCGPLFLRVYQPGRRVGTEPREWL